MMGQKKLPNKFLIAVDKYNDDWDSKSIELKGKLGPGHEAVWQKAVEEYFTNRLNVRYMKPIGLLQQSKPSNKGEGFLLSPYNAV